MKEEIQFPKVEGRSVRGDEDPTKLTAYNELNMPTEPPPADDTLAKEE